MGVGFRYHFRIPDHDAGAPQPNECHRHRDAMVVLRVDLDLRLRWRALGPGAFDDQTIVELLYFAGLNVAETAEALGMGKRTVEEHWALARTWLRARLG